MTMSRAWHGGSPAPAGFDGLGALLGERCVMKLSRLHPIQCNDYSFFIVSMRTEPFDVSLNKESGKEGRMEMTTERE
jgi:hypothetical protein